MGLHSARTRHGSRRQAALPGDERRRSEPGTCKDIPLMFMTPHFLVEGAIIASSRSARRTRSFTFAAKWFRCCAGCAPLWRRTKRGMSARHPGLGIRPRDHRARRRRVHLRRGDRASRFVGGSARTAETAPAVPAVSGLYACPTVVNNVESIASVPPIILNGVNWFRSMGSEKSPGSALRALRDVARRASTRRRWGSRCANCSTTPAACGPGIS